MQLVKRLLLGGLFASTTLALSSSLDGANDLRQKTTPHPAYNSTNWCGPCCINILPNINYTSITTTFSVPTLHFPDNFNGSDATMAFGVVFDANIVPTGAWVTIVGTITREDGITKATYKTSANWINGPGTYGKMTISAGDEIEILALADTPVTVVGTIINHTTGETEVLRIKAPAPALSLPGTSFGCIATVELDGSLQREPFPAFGSVTFRNCTGGSQQGITDLNTCAHSNEISMTTPDRSAYLCRPHDLLDGTTSVLTYLGPN